MPEFDVIVAGAGPAGSLLAYHLASAGLKTLLLEKATMPRYKTCGGGITWKTFRQVPFDSTPALELEAIGGRMTYAGRPVMEVGVERPFAWLTMRDRFDAYLAEKATAAGATFRQNQPVTGFMQSERQVTVSTPAGAVTAAFLAGADGVNSVIARQSGLLPDRLTGTAIEAEIEVPAAALAQQGPFANFDFGAIPWGYGWIFPKRDHLSVGVFQARPGPARDIRAWLDRYIAAQPILGGHTLAHLQGHRIPLGGRPGPLHSGRVLLVGDAANLADPFMGEGIYYAALSASLAARAILAAHSGQPGGLSGYSRQAHAHITTQHASARFLGSLIYPRPWFAAHLLRRSLILQDLIFAVMRGQKTFSRMNLEMVLRLPFIVLQVFVSTLSRG